MKKKQQPKRQTSREAPDAFCDWWNPSRVEEPSGAAVGGHPDAKRVWARKDAGKWTRRTYGTTAAQAWLADCYRQEYEAWVAAGRPKQPEPFVSLAATVERQKEFWHGVATDLRKIVKPVPKAKQRDYDKGKAPWKEPIDEKPKALPEPFVEGEFTKLKGDEDEPIPF